MSPGTPKLTRPKLWLLIALSVAGFLTTLIVGGLIFLGSLFAAGSPALSKRILAEINKAAGTDSTRFAGDRVHGTLLHGAVIENPRLLVRTQSGEVTWARARRLKVEYDLFDLLLGHTQDLRVDLDAPRIDLVHDAAGEVVVPRFAHRESKTQSTRRTQLEVTIRDGGFSVDREQIRFGQIHGLATLNFGHDRSDLLIRNLSGVSQTQGRPGWLRMNGRVVVAGDSLRAEPLHVSVGESQITARAEWDLAQGRFRAGTLTLHPLHLQEFLRVFDVNAAPGTLQGEVTFSGTPTDGRATVRLDGDYAGEPIDTLILDANSRPGAVEMSRVEIKVRDTMVQGQGLWNTQGSLSGTFAFRGIDPATLPWWNAPKDMPGGLLAGTAKVQARRAKPRPQVDATIDLAESRFGRLEIHGGSLRIHSSPDGAVSMDSSFLDLPGATVALEGALARDRSLQAVLHGTISDLQEFNPLLGSVAVESGTGRVTARLSGTLDAPTFVSQGDLFGARLSNGLACDTMTVEAQGRLLPKLDLTGDVGARGLRAGDHALGNVDAIVSGGERLTIERYRQSLGDTLLTMHGVLSFASGGIRADLDSLRLHSASHNLHNRGPVRISSLEDRVRIQNLALDLDPGVLEADVDWDPKGSTIDARGRVVGLDLARLQGLSDTTQLGGLVRGEFQATGRIEDPTISLSGRVDRPEWNGIVGDSLAV
ncbi:MAG: hypothetical protein ACRENN_08120, partial [Candidatus Eiseniibacteriota bacterium]